MGTGASRPGGAPASLSDPLRALPEPADPARAGRAPTPTADGSTSIRKTAMETTLRPWMQTATSSALAAGLAALLAGSAPGAAPAFRAGPAAPTTGPTSGPQSGKATDGRAREELEFARGLAADWGFVDLAQKVVLDLEARGVSERIEQELGLAKCSIYFAGAKANPDNREALLKQALEAYQDFVERNSFSVLLPQAESELIGVASYYSRYLRTELEDAVGEEAERLRTEMMDVLDTAINKTGDLVAGLQAIPTDTRSATEERQLYELLFNRGEMLLEMAKIQEDGSYSFESSQTAFEQLVDEAGENSPWGLRGFIGIGDNLVAQGLYEDAAAFYEFVVDLAIPRDQQAWDDAKAENAMTLDEIQQRFLFVQMATGGLVEAYANSGDAESAARWGMHFYRVWKKEGLSLVQPVGHLSLLEVARTLVDAGGVIGGNPATGEARWYSTDDEAAKDYPAKRDRRPAVDMALSMAQTVNAENRGNTLQLRAQAVISEIIERPGIQVDPETLFEAAQGSYYERDYLAAIDGFKRVLASLQGHDEAKQLEIGPKTLNHLGRSFQSLSRDLEAAVVFREAVKPEYQGRFDPEFGQRNASRYYEAMRAVRSQTASQDELVEAWWRDAENWAQELTDDLGAEVEFRNAYEAYRDQDYEKAREGFLKVEPSADSYEKGMVFVGVSEYQLGNLEAAEQVFDTYINKFLKDPVNAVNDPRREARRSEAEATAWFYWGLVEYKQAEAGGDWQAVVDKLGDFHQRFPDQTSFAPAALYRAMIAETKQGDNKAARTIYETMLEVFGDSQWTGQASTDFYQILKAQQEAAEDPEAKRALLVEMAEALEVLNSTSQSPSFTNMRAESRHWMELGEWAKAEALLRKLVTQFGASQAADVEKYVVPDLGEALMRQYKVQEAADTLAPLVEAKTANRNTARLYALCLVGWLDHTEENGKLVIKQVKGVGGPEGFSTGTDILNQITEASEKWEQDWYGLKLELIYGYHQWGALDGKKLETARGQIDFLITNLGPQFQHEKISEPLRQKFLWLAGELK